MGNSDGNKKSTRQPKVARLIEEYGLSGIGDEMEHLWTADSSDRRSLRELATYFNRSLLSARLEDADVQTLSGETENIYELLTGDVSSADNSRMRRRLERHGIDVDSYLSDTVSYQAIRTYLRECRNAEYAGESGDPTAAAATSIRRLRGRTASVTESKLEGLQSAGHLDPEPFRVIVKNTIICEVCGSQYGASEFAEQGGCGCEGTSP